MFSELTQAIFSPLVPLPRLKTGIPSVDVLTGGGFPIGQIIELSGQTSSGKSSLAFHVCGRALTLGHAVAWIGPTGAFWPLAALESGLPTERLVVLHVGNGLSGLRAAQILLGCPSAVAVLVLDVPLSFAPRPVQIQRLQRLAERSGTVLIMLTERSPLAPALGPAVALRIHARRPAGATETDLRLVLEVLRHKGGPTQQSSEEQIHGPDRLCVHSSL